MICSFLNVFAEVSYNELFSAALGILKNENLAGAILFQWEEAVKKMSLGTDKTKQEKFIVVNKKKINSNILEAVKPGAGVPADLGATINAAIAKASTSPEEAAKDALKHLFAKVESADASDLAKGAGYRVAKAAKSEQAAQGFLTAIS